MKISIGADHRGFHLKTEIITHFSDYTWLDVGTNTLERTDYPIPARDVCHNILEKKSEIRFSSNSEIEIPTSEIRFTLFLY